MVQLYHLLSLGDRARLRDLKDVLIVAPAIRGKKGNAAYAAARRALKSAGVKKVHSLGRLVKIGLYCNNYF